MSPPCLSSTGMDIAGKSPSILKIRYGQRQEDQDQMPFALFCMLYAQPGDSASLAPSGAQVNILHSCRFSNHPVYSGELQGSTAPTKSEAAGVFTSHAEASPTSCLHLS